MSAGRRSVVDGPSSLRYEGYEIEHFGSLLLYEHKSAEFPNIGTEFVRSDGVS